MKTLFTAIILLFSTYLLQAQTVVRMRMPAQSENELSVATLFNEALPTGVSIVLGVIGYEINGGTAPYQYQWLKDNQVIATGEVAVIVPENGKSYVLRVKDKNNCSVDNAINISSAAKANKSYLSETVKISLLPSNQQLSIDFKGFVPENITLSVFDMNGKLYLKQPIGESTTVSLQLPLGTYLAVVGNGQMYHVQKIMLK